MPPASEQTFEEFEAEAATIAASRGVKLFEFGKPNVPFSLCRWHLRGEGVGFIVCGRAVSGSSYCEFHNRMAFSDRMSR